MKKKFLPIGFLFLFLFLPLFDLFHPGLPITHDGQDHVARIANFYQNLQDGILVPRWAPNLNWGYGHPILMFLYPLPSYMTSLFHSFGFSFVDSLKIIFGVSFILSGLTMYLWLRSFLSLPAAFVGSLLYTFAPYRFVDLYVRGAIGEHVAFIFPPLVLYFLYRLSKKQTYRYWLGGSLSFAGLILAHNAISLMFLPIILLYSVYLLSGLKKKKSFIRTLVFLFLFGFGLSAFFWMPAFVEGKFTLRDIVTKGEALSRFVPVKDFFYGPWSYGISGQFTVQFGMLNLLAVISALPLAIYFFRKKNPQWIFIGMCLLLFFVTAFLMTEGAKPIWQTVTLLQKFQFPWRLLSLSVFLSAVLGACAFSVFSSRVQKSMLVVFIIAVLFFNRDYWHAKAYLYKPENFYTGIYNSTTDTGESAPIWSIRFMLERPKAHMEVIEGKGKISEKQRTATMHDYIVVVSGKARLKENTLFFPGWKVFVDGKSVPLQFQDANNRGLMTFFVEKGTHTVSAQFGETKLRLFADCLSIGSIFSLGIVGMLGRRKVWRS